MASRPILAYTATHVPSERWFRPGLFTLGRSQVNGQVLPQKSAIHSVKAQNLAQTQFISRVRLQNLQAASETDSQPQRVR